MAPDRRFRTFNDYLRARFGDRVQRVTLTGGLVCPLPEGREKCDFCQEAVRIDPTYGQGHPVHEQIRRGINFSRRKGNSAPLIHATVLNPKGLCAPADHLQATFASVAAQPGVVMIAFTSPPACVTAETAQVIREFASPERDLWIEFLGIPSEWPIPRDEAIHFGVQVPFQALEAENPGVSSEEQAVAMLTHLNPDAVGFVAPVIVDGSPEAGLYESGELDEPELDAFAARVARVLERIPATVAVHPVVLTERSDSVLGPRWALNRQKVQEAIGHALEKNDSSQGRLEISA